MSENKCAVPEHKKALKIYSPDEKRFINRGQCQDHMINGLVTYWGTYKDNGEPVLITHIKLKNKLHYPKCTLKCRSGMRKECPSANSSDVTNAIKEYINLLSGIKHVNLLGYKSSIVVVGKNCTDIYLVRDVDKKSTSAKIISNTTKWEYTAIGNAITSVVEAIHYLHQNNIPHGHLSNTSIFVTDANVWKVADFFLMSYMRYLLQKKNHSCFVLDERADVKAIGQFIKSFDIPSKKLYELVNLCKTADIVSIKNHTLLKDISRFSRLEAEFHEISYLGEGAFGDVLKVKSYTDNKEYAIKRVKLSSKGDRDFNNANKEAQSFSKLSHKNIVKYHISWTEIVDETTFNSYKPSNDNHMDVEQLSLNGYNNDDPHTVGVMYILMELCNNQNLSSIIEEGILREDVMRLHRYVIDILEGIMYMHSEKVIHCDIKPDNLLLSLNDDRIKIGDFGLTATTKSVLERYRSGDESLIHIAPELLEKNTRSRNTDMYSFGIVLFEMCFGPFENNNERSRLLNIIMNENGNMPTQYIRHPIYCDYIEIMRGVLTSEARKRLQAKLILKYLNHLDLLQ